MRYGTTAKEDLDDGRDAFSSLHPSPVLEEAPIPDPLISPPYGEGYASAYSFSVQAVNQMFTEDSAMATPNRKLINGLTVLALLLVGAFGAEAQNQKIFPGTLCTQLGYANASRVFYFNRGDACNVTPGTMLTVSCPIVRDNVNEEMNFVIVTFEDNNPDLNPVCSAINFTPERGFCSLLSLGSQPQPAPIPRLCLANCQELFRGARTS
jgi:hypothetical protein